jgi:polyphosphate kinase
MVYGLVERRLAEEGIRRLEPSGMNDEERGVCFDFFRDELKPFLKTSIISKDEKLPYLDEERTYLIANLDAEMEDRFGLVDIPAKLPKVFVMNDEVYLDNDLEDDILRVSSIIGSCSKPCFRYVLSEDIIKTFADTLFVPFVPTEIYSFDIARTAEVAPEKEAANTVKGMRKIINKRKYASADKLITDGKPSTNLRAYLGRALDLNERQMFTTTRIDFSYLDELAEKLPEDNKDDLFYEPHIPYDQTADIDGSLIDEIRKRDILSCYPYDSVDVFLGLLREAAFMPDVSEIRITIYRLASNPRITDYLIYAARNGKKVRVILELRARFDEEKNLAWAERLRNAGCKVYYGNEKYKVHSKLC